MEAPRLLLIAAIAVIPGGCRPSAAVHDPKAIRPSPTLATGTPPVTESGGEEAALAAEWAALEIRATPSPTPTPAPIATAKVGESRAAILRSAGERAARNRVFVTERTWWERPRAQPCPLSGPCPPPGPCRLEFAVTPAAPLQAQPYTVDIIAENPGRGILKVRDVTASVSVNGYAAPIPVAPRAREVPPGERRIVGSVRAEWALGTTAWSLAARLVDDSGDRHRARVAWDLNIGN